MDSNIAMTVVMGAAGYKSLELVLVYFFKKVTKDDYVTKKSCDVCGKQRDTSLDKLVAEISIIKGLLLVLAVKNGVPPEQLTNLTK